MKEDIIRLVSSLLPEDAPRWKRKRGKVEARLARKSQVSRGSGFRPGPSPPPQATDKTTNPTYKTALNEPSTMSDNENPPEPKPEVEANAPISVKVGRPRRDACLVELACLT